MTRNEHTTRTARFSSTLGIAAMACLAACNSDRPDNLEPHIATLTATDITRTEATLNGLATVEGATAMPRLRFRYGTTEDMAEYTPAANANGTSVSAHIANLTAATTYYYRLEGSNGKATVRGNTVTFTTLPNEKPSLGETNIVSHGPMSVIIGYDIADDGGETITETGCLYAHAQATDDPHRVQLADYKGGTGRHTLTLDGLSRNTTYTIWPYAKSRMGETVGNPVTYTTGEAVSLGEAGQLRTLLGNDMYGFGALAFAGPLNGDDLGCLRDMMGRGHDNAATQGRLTDVDLTDVRIVAGGEPYDGTRYAADNVVGQGLFADCTRLARVALPNGATTIEKEAFARCTALASIGIPAAATAVQPSSGCTALQSINVSGANTSYTSRDGVLLNADATQVVWFPMGKHGDYSLPSTVTSVADYAFKGCNVGTFTLPDNITSLGTGTFMDSNVTEVKMPANLRLVPTATFQGCTKLGVVRLGGKTELIADHAFSACPLTDIYIDATLPPVCSALSFATVGHEIFSTCKVHVPKGKASMYKSSNGWKLFKNITTD